jgi:hypothetical protein
LAAPVNGTPLEPSEPDEDGGQAGKAASRPVPWLALLVIILAGAAAFALIRLTPGLDTGTRAALGFILAPVVVTPIFCLTTWAVAPGFPTGAVVVGSVLGGEIAALLYAAGQSGRFTRWAAAIEVVAMLMAPGTLYVLRVAKIPGVGQGDEMPSPAGIALIIALAPFALAACILYGMARWPVGTVVGSLAGGVAAAFTLGHPLVVLLTLPLAALLALAPAGVRRVIMRARQTRT